MVYKIIKQLAFKKSPSFAVLIQNNNPTNYIIYILFSYKIENYILTTHMM